jgi:hypothetical protein
MRKEETEKVFKTSPPNPLSVYGEGELKGVRSEKRESTHESGK